MISGIYFGVAGALLAGSVIAMLILLIKNPALPAWGAGAGSAGKDNGGDASPFDRIARAVFIVSAVGFGANIIASALALRGAILMRRGRDAGRRALLSVSYFWSAGVVAYGLVWMAGWTAVCFSGASVVAGEGAALKIVAWIGGFLIGTLFIVILLGPLSFFIRALGRLRLDGGEARDAG